MSVGRGGTLAPGGFHWSLSSIITFRCSLAQQHCIEIYCQGPGLFNSLWFELAVVFPSPFQNCKIKFHLAVCNLAKCAAGKLRAPQ